MRMHSHERVSHIHDKPQGDFRVMGAASPHIAGMPKRVAAGLRPNSEAMRLPAYLYGLHLTVDVSIAYTRLSKRPDNQSAFPSALTFPMSGLPPPGTNQVTLTARVAKSITLTLPGP
jgi:hypothetical protein